MKRRTFLTLSALSPLAAYFGFKAKPALAAEGEGDEMPVLPPLDWSKIHVYIDRLGGATPIYDTGASDSDNFVYADNGTAILRQRKGKAHRIHVPMTVSTVEVNLSGFGGADLLSVSTTHLAPHLQAECQANLTARATKLIERARAAGTNVNQIRVAVDCFRVTRVNPDKWQVVYELGMWAYQTDAPQGLAGNLWGDYRPTKPLYNKESMSVTLNRNLFPADWNV